MPLLTFTGLCDLVYAGEPIKYACLPSYMHDDLALPPVISGAVIGIQPLIELILMGGVWGIFAGLGIIVAQRLLPGAIATASAIFMSSTAIASALGGSPAASVLASSDCPTYSSCLPCTPHWPLSGSPS